MNLAQVDEKTREQMFKLRQTWSEIFAAKTLHALDSKVHQIDPAWPVSAPPPTILLNPKFFKKDVIVSDSLCFPVQTDFYPFAGHWEISIILFSNMTLNK